MASLTKKEVEAIIIDTKLILESFMLSEEDMQIRNNIINLFSNIYNNDIDK